MDRELGKFLYNSYEKGKVLPVYAINAYRRSTGIAPLILNLRTWWRRVVSFISWLIYPYEKNPSIQWTGGWVGPRASLDNLE